MLTAEEIQAKAKAAEQEMLTAHAMHGMLGALAELADEDYRAFCAAIAEITGSPEPAAKPDDKPLSRRHPAVAAVVREFLRDNPAGGLDTEIADMVARRYSCSGWRPLTSEVAALVREQSPDSDSLTTTQGCGSTGRTITGMPSMRSRTVTT